MAYRPKGEEVDGSFIFHDRTFLLEAKWWSESVPASAIYQFKGKVDGKLVGTIGIFISMSAYSDDAVDALRVGKVLNIVLLDRDDIFAAAEDGFGKVLAYKLRAVAEQGEVFTPYRPAKDRDKLAIIVEGPRDKIIVDAVISNLKRRGRPVREQTIMVAMGTVGLSHVATVTASAGEGDVLVVADADGLQPDVWSGTQPKGQKLDVIQVAPGVEKWIGFDSHYEARQAGSAEVKRRANQIDIDDLARTDEAFRRLIELLKKRPG